MFIECASAMPASTGAASANIVIPPKVLILNPLLTTYSIRAELTSSNHSFVGIRMPDQAVIFCRPMLKLFP
ncbi:MAG: hypothetical protein O8C64_04685, partial [Candidatus Methanoperedens sp.]|nr:hypothetical protein [Candidatus Methanoperedens sp.]